MKLLLVRHTKPAIPEGICYGQTDIDTADSFDMEREVILERLGETNITKIYSSPLIRCAKLARSFSPRYGSVAFDDRLKEFNFGDWEMKHWSEIEKEPTIKSWYRDYIHMPVPGGESFNDLIHRVRSFCRDIQKEWKEEAIMVVCHGGVIRAFDIIIHGSDPLRAFDLEIGFGAIHEISLEEPV